jgi:hypothetical protein
MRGFRRSGESCVAVDVPANGYLSASGGDWECERGYRKADRRCEAIRVPANAYADDSTFGRGWRCDRGYREAGDACMRVAVPVNAYGTDSSFGRGWECSRGFRVDGDACAAVKVPRNAFLARSGDDWECERGFAKPRAAGHSACRTTRTSIIPATHGVATKASGNAAHRASPTDPQHLQENCMISDDSTYDPSDRAGSKASDFQRDYRARLALERLEADERRERELMEQASLLNDPQARIRAWEKAHALTLPRDPEHPVLLVVCAATQLDMEQVREEQRRRAAPRTPAASVPEQEIPPAAAQG